MKFENILKQFNRIVPKNILIRDIIKWLMISVFINLIIMYLNPVSLTMSEFADNIFLSSADKIFKFALNYLVFVSIGILLFLFKFKDIYLSIYSIIWLGLGLANNVLISVRNSPLTKYDFTMISEGISLGKSFLNKGHYIKIILFALFAVVLIYFNSRKNKKTILYDHKKIIISWIVSCILLAGMSSLISLSYNEHIDNYHKCGFIYAFSENLVTPDIKKPSKYNSSTMLSLKSQIDAKYSNVDLEEKPNIIAIQLESFFDVKTVDGLKLSENPTPYFDKLCEDYTSGYAKVPTIGGGTARSEFEFITGLSLKYMKDGLIPHNSILKEAPYFSSVYVLRENNYKTHLLHNFAGYFYNRDIVYNNLGFDTFTSLEFLNDASDNPSVIKASRDKIFPSEIKKLLETTESKDFIFGITTQLHGNYETNYTEFENGIVASGDFDKEQLSQMNDYVNEIKSVDNVIKDIIAMVEDFDEPTIVIFYGDHLPPLNYKNTNIKGDTKYLVPYVVWDNMNLKKENNDLNLYELLSKYINYAGIEGNYLNKLQSIDIDNELKEKYQEYLQYDITSGKNYIQEKYLPYKVDTKLGSNDIIITEVDKEDDITYVIKGSGFTASMVLVVDEAECGIIFENESTIKFSTNLDLSNKDIYFKIRIGKNENSVVKSNIYKVK